MKKLALLASATLPFFTATVNLVQAAEIKITPPANKGYSDLGAFISNFLVLAFGIAIIVVLAMLIWGAFEWITSGGDKDAVGKARGRIINALIGLAVLSIAFALTRVAGQFLGFDITQSIPIPTPPPAAP